jgi:gas vesicle protein
MAAGFARAGFGVFEEDVVDDRGRVLGATLLGAAVGGLAGYLFLTESGRALRREFEPKLDNALAEIRRLRGAILKLKEAAREGQRSFDEVLGQKEESPNWATAYRSNSGF